MFEEKPDVNGTTKVLLTILKTGKKNIYLSNSQEENYLLNVGHILFIMNFPKHSLIYIHMLNQQSTYAFIYACVRNEISRTTKNCL